MSGCGSSVFALEVGDCFQSAGEGVTEVSSLETVDCSQPHDNEVYAVTDLPDGEYPADAPAQAADYCEGDAFTDFIGVAWLDSEFSYTTIYPTAETWADGDREVVCALYRDDGEQMTGSQRGVAVADGNTESEDPEGGQTEAVAEQTDTPAGGQVKGEEPTQDPGAGSGSTSVFDLTVGDCFQDPDAAAPDVSLVETVDCGQPHDNEVYAVLDLPEGPFPADVAAQASGLCEGAPFTEFVGVEWLESDFSHFEIYPTAESWDQGDREVVCALYRDDFEPMTGSQRGVGAG